MVTVDKLKLVNWGAGERGGEKGGCECDPTRNVLHLWLNKLTSADIYSPPVPNLWKESESR